MRGGDSEPGGVGRFGVGLLRRLGSRERPAARSMKLTASGWEMDESVRWVKEVSMGRWEERNVGKRG